jgi:hypothetical protein
MRIFESQLVELETVELEQADSTMTLKTMMTLLILRMEVVEGEEEDLKVPQ